MVSPFNVFPPSWGTGRRIHSLAIHLSRYRRVFLVCNGFPAHVDRQSLREAVSRGGNLSVEIVQGNGRHSQLFNPRMLLKTLGLLKSENFSVVYGQFLWSASTCIPAAAMSNIPFVLDMHNVESNRLTSVRSLSPGFGRLLRRLEAVSCRAAKKVICVSEPDRQTLNKQLRIPEEKLELVPHGAEFSVGAGEPGERRRIRESLGLEPNDPMVLFFGPADYAPNREAAYKMRNVIAPRVLRRTPDAKFVVVGRGWENEASSDSFHFHGYVRRINRLIAAADVVAVPLYHGGGAQLKVVESLANGTPVVTTPFVAQKFATTVVEQAIAVAQNDMDLADMVSDSLANPGLPFSVQEIKRELSWATVSESVNEILNGLEG